MKNEIKKAIAKIDIEIWTKYESKTELSSEDQERLNYQLARVPERVLEADLEEIFAEHAEGMYDVIEEIRQTIKGQYDKQVEEALERIMEEALKSAKIRVDFASALKKVEYGSELSGKIGYGLSMRDIENLAKLHKSSGADVKEKIEDLLEDCNFHYECGLLSEGNYDELLKNSPAN